VKFWDASAIVPLVVAEEETIRCRGLLAEDSEVVVCFLTPVEVCSALNHRLREGSLKLPDFRKAKERLLLLQKAWSEVVSIERVRERALRLLETHALRAADALQLAAAIIVSEENPGSLAFLTLDSRLGLAAEKERFPVLALQK
jgi:predicted nucleic acid-binding protein